MTLDEAIGLAALMHSYWPNWSLPVNSLAETVPSEARARSIFGVSSATVSISIVRARLRNSDQNRAAARSDRT